MTVTGPGLTFHLLEKDLTDNYVDVDPKGIPFQRVSPGDAFYFVSALLYRPRKADARLLVVDLRVGLLGTLNSGRKTVDRRNR